MRYLWILSFAIIVIGVTLIVGHIIALFEAIAMVAGLLLLWCGIVKVIVLIIWRSFLQALALPDRKARAALTSAVIGR